MSVWRSPRGIVNDPAQDVQFRRVEGAIGTVIVLAGVQGGLNYLPFALVDGLLARLPVNVVYLRDLNNRAFTAGVASLGPDANAMASGLRAIACQLGGQKVVTIGASVGGLAAVRAAVQMGAHAAISFAGPTTYGADPQDGEAALADGKGARDTIFTAFTRTETNLEDMIRAAPGTRVFQCFGARYAPDVANAEALRPLPNVVLVPVPDCADHFVIEHIIAGGEFDALLRRAIGSSPEHP
jgi:pimeloyl-ACP methyl ester carboxylesterase